MQLRKMGPFLATLLVSAVAVAQPTGSQDTPEKQVNKTTPSLVERLEPDITVGAGMAGFTGKILRSYFDAGPAWHVRAGVGEWTAVRFEVVYSGSIQDANAPDRTPGARLVGHGVHAQFRINVLPGMIVEPFFFAGAGYSRYDVTGGSAGMGVRGHDNTIEVPIGIGAAYRYKDFYFDVRAAFGALSSAELVPVDDPDSSQKGASMHRFGLRAYIGYAM